MLNKNNSFTRSLIVHLTNALYAALIRYLNRQPETNPDEVSVVKTAFNIKSNTLHSAFKVPANRGFSYCTLDRDRLKPLGLSYKNSKLFLLTKSPWSDLECLAFLT